MSLSKDLSLHHTILCAGFSACLADLLTFPLDTAKVRLQIQGESAIIRVAANSMLAGNEMVQYRGMFGTIFSIAKHEGPKSLFNGLAAGLQRQLCFSSIRIGLYDSVKTIYQEMIFNDSTKSHNSIRVLAGITTGGLAALVAQPTDVVKVRFQAQLKVGSEKRYKSTMQAYKTIAKQEGRAGLWKGTIPSAGRNAIVNVSEIVCYDIIKSYIVSEGILKDAPPCHFLAAVIAGLCATTVASPVDVIKTRYMNSAPGTYKSSLNCAMETFKQEGPSAFFKGFMPSFCRLVSWNIVMWLTYEKAMLVIRTHRETNRI